MALHHHASTFYTSHSLLVTPKKQVRAEQWGSKKRLLLEADGVGSDGRQTGAQVSESDTADGEEAEEAEAAEEGKEVAEEISSDHHNARAEDDHEKTEEQGERGERPGHTGTARQRYKKRDMYKAMDGSALLALGE